MYSFLLTHYLTNYILYNCNYIYSFVAKIETVLDNSQLYQTGAMRENKRRDHTQSLSRERNNHNLITTVVSIFFYF